jgi:hypothetical protein
VGSDSQPATDVECDKKSDKTLKPGELRDVVFGKGTGSDVKKSD